MGIDLGFVCCALACCSWDEECMQCWGVMIMKRRANTPPPSGFTSNFTLTFSTTLSCYSVSLRISEKDWAIVVFFFFMISTTLQSLGCATTPWHVYEGGGERACVCNVGMSEGM